jgi:hypothetical protein
MLHWRFPYPPMGGNTKCIASGRTSGPNIPFSPPSQQATDIRANAINWNKSKLVEYIKSKSHFSNFHTTRCTHTDTTHKNEQCEFLNTDTTEHLTTWYMEVLPAAITGTARHPPTYRCRYSKDKVNLRPCYNTCIWNQSSIKLLCHLTRLTCKNKSENMLFWFCIASVRVSLMQLASSCNQYTPFPVCVGEVGVYCTVFQNLLISVHAKGTDIRKSSGKIKNLNTLIFM